MRSLWPREHGAYAQLAIPLVTALVLAMPTLPALAIAVAACCAFLANEPLLVVIGDRGRRAQQEVGGRARRRLAVLGSAAVVAGLVGLALAPRAALLAGGLVVPFALALVALAFRQGEHSLVPELLAAIVLPGAGAPVAIASGVAAETALQLWLAWSLGYLASVVAVRDVIANRRGRTRAASLRAVALVGVAAGLVAIALARPLLWVAAPIAGAAAVVAVVSPSPRALRAIGVAMVVASLAGGALALVG